MSIAGANTIAVGAFPGLLSAAAEHNSIGPQDFRFVFFTDTHIQPELDAARGTEMAMKKARLVRADFAIQGGDLVFDAAKVDRTRATSLFDLYGKVEQDLGMKVYHTMGNHDVFGAASDAAKNDPLYGRKMYEERYGKTYYSFEHKGYYFIVLDSVEYQADHSLQGHIGVQQLQWIAVELGRVPIGAPIVVILHIPLVTSALTYMGPSSYKYAALLTTTNAADIIALFEGYNVIGVLQGHTHIYETVLWKGIPYITGGAVSGNWWRGSHLGIPEGFTVIDAVNGKLVTRYETFGFKSIAAPAAGHL